MQSNILDSEIHLGHRERMRRKLIAYGGEIFDTYELLEMLLYSVIPVRDTNPISKRLLAALGGLDGVLSADHQKLLSIDGIGKTAAEYLSVVGRLPGILALEKTMKKSLTSYDDIGRYFISHYEKKAAYTVSILLLDNSMRPIKIVDLYSCDYGSGSVQCKPFLDVALENGASVAVIGHNHPYGPLYPAHSDIVSHRLIHVGFKHSGVDLLDHYLVSGNGYVRIGEIAPMDKSVSGMLGDFGILTVEANVGGLMDIDILTGTSDVEREYLEDYLSYTIANDEKRRAVSSRLFEIYHGLDGILCRSYEELEAVSGSQSAISLKLLACVSSRRFTDKVMKGRRLGEWLGEYFAWHFFGISNETVCLALFDKNDKLINITKLSEGTVNASEIVPRKAMEAAARASAKSAVLAHNHPGGISVSSRNDELVTTIIKAALANVGTELVCHLIVAGHDVGVVSIPVEKS